MEDEDRFSQPKAKCLCKCGLCFPEVSWEYGLAAPCHQSCCIHLLRTRVQALPMPVLGLERGFLENKPLAAGKARRAGEPANSLCFCSGRRCDLGWDVLLWGTVCSSLLLSHFCHSLLPPLFYLFFIQGLFFLMCCSHSRTSGKGSQMEKTIICFLSFSIFACVHVFPLTSANSVKMGGREKK